MKGPQPVTEADWKLYDRGEWPPKTKPAAKPKPKPRPKPTKPAAAEATVEVVVQPERQRKPIPAAQTTLKAKPAAEPRTAAKRPSAKIVDLDEPDDLDEIVEVDKPAKTVVGIKGCEQPRIYTKERRELTEDTSDGWAAIAFAEEMLGMGLFPWQKWLLIHALELNEDYTYRFRTVIMSQSRQNGKALDAATPILTTNGWSTMGVLQVGDEVFHPDGHSTRVIGAFDVMHGHDCYEVTTTDGRSVVADAEHLWTVKDMRRSKKVDGVRTHLWETLTTEQLLERGLRVSPQRAGNDFAFRLPRQHRIMSKPVELPIDPYLLGVWLGDGTSWSAEITIGRQDLEALTYQLTEAGARIVSVRADRRHDSVFSVRISIDKPIRDGFEARIKKLGVWRNKHVPPIYLTAGTEQRQALLAGLLDTDGYISKAGQVSFAVTNERLADDVLYLARSLGWRATKRTGRSKLNGHDYGPYFEVCFTPDESPFRLARKSERITPRAADRSAISIKSIERVDSRPVRCIKVDRDDGLFLAGDGLMPTHNTFLMVILALWHLYCKGSRTIIATAQDLSKAEDAWNQAVEFAQSDEEMNELIRKISLAHPKLLKVLNPLTGKLCEYRVASKSRGGGRGYSGDLVLLDELREHQNWDSWSAISKTQMARPRAQAWAFTNAGDSLSVVWRYQRAAAHQKLGWPDGDQDAPVLGEVDPNIGELLAQLEKEFGSDMQVGWFEWSAPPNAKRTDREAWAQANGSLNHIEVVEDCVTERAIAHALYTDPVSVFDQEVMCRFVPFSDGGPFPDGAWRATCDENGTARPAAKARSVMCLEVSVTRSAAVIAKATLDDNGNPIVGIAEMLAGTDWCLDWLLERRGTFAGVVVRSGAGSPVLSLLQQLLEAKLPNGRDANLPIIEWKTMEVGAAFGQLFDKVRDRTIQHLPHQGLDSAACSATPKLQSGGGWIVDPLKSPSDVSPLYAATGAVWGLSQLPDDGPSIYSDVGGAVEVLAF